MLLTLASSLYRLFGAPFHQAGSKARYQHRHSCTASSGSWLIFLRYFYKTKEIELNVSIYHMPMHNSLLYGLVYCYRCNTVAVSNAYLTPGVPHCKGRTFFVRLQFRIGLPQLSEVQSTSDTSKRLLSAPHTSTAKQLKIPNGQVLVSGLEHLEQTQEAL